MAEEKKKEAVEDKEKKEGEGTAAEGAVPDEAAGAAAKKKKKMMIIIGGAAVTLLFVVGIGVAFLMGGSGEGGEGKKEAASEEFKDKPAYYPLGDMIVNLSGEGKRPNYLKVKVTLELADEKDAQLLDLIKPRIVDNFQVYLRELRIEDLRGSAGMYRLREELLMRVTEAAQPLRIRDVLFQEMLVQ